MKHPGTDTAQERSPTFPRNGSSQHCHPPYPPPGPTTFSHEAAFEKHDLSKKQTWISEQRSWGYQSIVTVREKYIFHCCHIVCVLVAKSCLTLATPWTVACQAPFPWDSPGRTTGVGCQSLLQGSSGPRDRTQVSFHCRQILLLSEPLRKPCHIIVNQLFQQICWFCQRLYLTTTLVQA